MYIGYMGTVVFAVSERYLLTPSDFERSGDARWNTHDVILKKPVSQFTGPGQENISFKLQLRSDYGVNPNTQLQTLRMMRDTGMVFPLIIGGRPVAQNYWYIESLGEGDAVFDTYGKPLAITASVSLKEYDDSNYTEEKTLIDKYGKAYNVVATLFGGI